MIAIPLVLLLVGLGIVFYVIRSVRGASGDLRAMLYVLGVMGWLMAISSAFLALTMIGM